MMQIARVENGELIAPSGAAAPVPWWSFTKTVIAAGALALVRDGHLALDAPLPQRRYTLRQLLQHRAGLTDYGALSAYHDAVARHDEPWPVAELLARTEGERLRCEPGSAFWYSNIGYLFVRRLIEQASGAPLGAALDRLVLQPLGITGARIATAPADVAGTYLREIGYHPGWVYHGLVIGPLDQAALLLARLMRSDLLPAALLDAMRDGRAVSASLPTDLARPWRVPGYGLGVMAGVTAHGVRVIGHTGGGLGSAVAVYHAPDARPPATVAAFARDATDAAIETAVFDRMEQSD